MKLVFATNNLHKIKEVQSLLPSTITLVSLTDIGCTEEIPETSPTIEGNAIQKATYVKKNYGYDCFADDTGLEIAALHGDPGVYSARYAGDQRNATDNMNKVLEQLKTKKDRKAQFKTVICLILGDTVRCLTGFCIGTITTQQKGHEGFGYDPIFLPDGYEQTFAELEIIEKNKISHRGKAVSQLITHLENLK